MRKIFLSVGTCVSIGFSAPLLAQMTTQPDQTQQYPSNQADQTLRPEAGAVGAAGATQGIQTLQDVRSPLTTIINRAATQRGGATGAPAPALTPGARPAFPGT